jgi:hypothetical protein
MKSLLFFFLPACSVCFGDPNSPETKGILAGVIFLMGILGIVLGSVGAAIYKWNKRSKVLSQDQQF